MMLGQSEVQLAQGKSLVLACKEAGISERVMDEYLELEFFWSLRGAQVVIGAWRAHDNRVRPHSSVGYRPSAPVTQEAFSRQPPCSSLTNPGPESRSSYADCRKALSPTDQPRAGAHHHGEEIGR